MTPQQEQMQILISLAYRDGREVERSYWQCAGIVLLGAFTALACNPPTVGLFFAAPLIITVMKARRATERAKSLLADVGEL